MSEVTVDQLQKLHEQIGALGRTANELFPEVAIVLLTLYSAMVDERTAFRELVNFCGNFAERRKAEL